MDTALLFDLDGTFADTEDLHFAAFVEVFAGHGVAVDAETYRSKIAGFPSHEIAAGLLPHLNAERGREVMDYKEQVYRDRVTHVDPPAGALALLDYAAARGVKSALVTNAPFANAARVLDVMGVRDRFAAIISAQDLAHSKPHPLPYLMALERLGAKAERSIAFEDAGSGVKAAIAAGIALVGVTSSRPEEFLVSLGARFAIADFNDPRIYALLDAQLKS